MNNLAIEVKGVLKAHLGGFSVVLPDDTLITKTGYEKTKAYLVIDHT